MLLHEFRALTPVDLNIGSDELYDATSTAGYTYYGFAYLTSVGGVVTAPDQTKPIWEIIVFKNNADGSPAATRYYPHNQIWANRTSLVLP